MNHEKQGENLMRTSFIARSRSLLFIVLLALTPLVSMAFEVQGDAANGKAIFNANCASCHKLDKKLVGPALGDVTERRELDWLVAWIKDNAALRASGDADAKAIFNEYNGLVMAAFPQLSDQDINDILAYTVEGNKPKVVVNGGGNNSPDPNTGASGDSNLVVLISLSVFLILLIFLLVKVKNTLKAVKGDPTSTLLEDSNFWTRTILRSKSFIILATIFVSVFLLREAYYGMMGVGLNAHYQPVQPIAFSHKIHAGDNKVDCNYCHSSARFSKHSGIPSTNVCMNCHMYIDGSEIQTETGELKYNGEKSPEIAKIYNAIGWDPENRSYIPDYEEKPVKWVRIHNLPDLAYFNHAQHVSAGQVECQTCHGPIQEMEEVYQYSPLTMGWCINCHRETEVQVESNGYYAELHAKLKEKYGDEPITVEKIGGLECGKCHY
jgi:mono/diheme cytochrome c family protein